MLRTKSICILHCISCMLFLPAVWQQSAAQDAKRFETSKQLEIFNAIVKEVEMFYVDSVEVEKMVRRGVDAMLKGFDPYTVYYPEEEMDELTYIISGEYGGIGSVIEQRKQRVVVSEPYEGMPAHLAGLKTGDVILAVDTTDVTNATTTRVSELLKGIPNSKVILTIQRPGEKKPRKIEIVRKQIAVNQVPYYGVRGDGFGYIYLSAFKDKSAQEVKAALEDLKRSHIKGLVLDLRDNGGGSLDIAVQIVNFFVPKGKEIVATRGRISQRDRIYRTSFEPVDTVMPVAVLINHNSASAAEIVCGALQDLDRAVLIGERSYGKGLVQSSFDLPYGGKIKLTVSKYYIPSGRCIQRMDYSHRKEDGSVAAIPDSMTSTFYTSNGRPVNDGGGVRPDIEVNEPRLPAILYYLAGDDALFDYVTEWAQKHATIAPIETFVYPDSDYETFKTYLKEKGFSYDRQSGRYLKELHDVAAFEGYLEEDSILFTSLEAKLVPDLERDLERYREQIRQLVALEIVKRYYFQKGEIIETLKNDRTLEAALNVLGDAALYRRTLSMPEK